MRLKFFILAMLGVVFAAGTAPAQQKVQGETWRSSVSMEMQGFSMPAQKMEFCAPVGEEPYESMIQQQQKNGDCRMANLKRSGGRTSFDIKCSGKDAMEGHMELETVGDTTRGTMTAKTEGIDMTMKYEITKLGRACQAQVVNANDAKKYDAPAKDLKAGKSEEMDICAIYHGNRAGGSVAEQSALFFRNLPGMPDCTKHAVFKNFCATVQTISPADFLAWDTSEENSGFLPVAFDACGLGSAAITASQAKLLPQAEKEKRWSVLLRYGADEYYPRMVELAKKECSGRGFTIANVDNGNLCRDYGMALVRNDRQAVLETAGCTEEIPERGICVGYGMESSGTRTTSPAAGRRSEENNPKEATDPAGRAKQKLRGLLGR